MATTSTSMRMEQWSALAPLTAQERDSVSRLASALSEAAAASWSFTPTPASMIPLRGAQAERRASSSPTTGADSIAAPNGSPAAAAAAGTAGREGGTDPGLHPAQPLSPLSIQQHLSPSSSTLPTPAAAAGTASPSALLSPSPLGGTAAGAGSSSSGTSTTATQQGMSQLQASQSAAVAALANLRRTLEEDVLEAHVLRANVNLAELRAGMRSVVTELG